MGSSRASTLRDGTGGSFDDTAAEGAASEEATDLPWVHERARDLWPLVLEGEPGRHSGREIARDRDRQRRGGANDRDAHERGRDGKRVDDGEVDDVGKRPVQQLLAVEAEQRAGQSADGEQQQALEQDRAPQLIAGKPSSFSFARRGRRCQTMLPIAAAIASTATTRISVAICVRR